MNLKSIIHHIFKNVGHVYYQFFPPKYPSSPLSLRFSSLALYFDEKVNIINIATFNCLLSHKIVSARTDGHCRAACKMIESLPLCEHSYITYSALNP